MPSAAEPDPNPAFSDPSGSRPSRRVLIKRILALALLGSAVALVVVQLTGLVRHEAHLQIGLDGQWTDTLERLELTVLAEGQPVSVAVFRFDERHRPRLPLEHRFQLANGSYELVFRLFTAGADQPLTARRTLEVSGDVRVRLALP